MARGCECHPLICPRRARDFHGAHSDCTPKIDSKQEGNLRQLLGFDPTANGSPRHEADDYFCLEDDVCESWLLEQSSGMLFPLFGSAPVKLGWLKKWATVDMSLSSFKRGGFCAGRAR